MLFSNESLALWINENFEPVWESVRPVPVVRVNFGGGHQVTRTLHGNTATYVCNADGHVIDILPGVYSRAEYRRQLSTIVDLAAACRGQEKRELQATLAAYHRTEYWKRPPLEEGSVPFASKRVVERPVEEAITGRPKGGSGNGGRTADPFPHLATDDRANEERRRPLIHGQLRYGQLVPPEELTDWLYRTVLETDLRDPLLGLGPMLVGSDPFERTR